MKIKFPCFLFFVLINFLNAQKVDSIAIALDLIDLNFKPSYIDSMKSSVYEEKENYKSIRKFNIENAVPNSLVFTPPINVNRIPENQIQIDWEIKDDIQLPENKSDLAFYSIRQLASLIKFKKITSVELTQFAIDRLKKYGDTLQCVITITESLALEQAKKADTDLAKGIYHGPLHGIPYGAKDLLAVEGFKTTWGAMSFKDQTLNQTATVIKKLEEAGAVLVAKLTLGALAWGDVWYGGKTKNPWDLTQGSSGSSAGSASATASGLVPFAIGSETWGSIVSPSTQCGTTGLRPTFGRVSKNGAMALSWSMDKLGPICRNAEDCAMVLEEIRGEDGMDLSVRNFPFNYSPKKEGNSLRIGYLKTALENNRYNKRNDSLLMAALRKKGVELVEKSFNSEIPTGALSFILSAEAGAAFDDLTRSKRDTLLVRQIKNAWPNVFRTSRLIPAVEYIQANRLRYLLTLEFNKMMEDIDVLIVPSFGDQLLITNLTGHPCVVLPNGSYAKGEPGSITLLGNHFDEASILSFAAYLQRITNFNREFPPMFLN